MSCQGQPIEMKDLRTPEQQAMMVSLANLINRQMGGGGQATPFGGQLSQPPDPGMLAAMNMMMQMGGQGPYQMPGFQAGPYPMPSQLGWGGSKDERERKKDKGERGRNENGNGIDRERRTREGYDPYAPWTWR